jgi:U4/U6 small nuclear ribonucleoprotein PRP31
LIILGTVGKQFREELQKKVDKWQEPPAPKLVKPLPAPDDRPRKKRGGKRMRKIKHKFEMTDLRKQTNRMSFDYQQEENRATGIGLGMLGLSGGGKVLLSAQDKGFQLH